MSTLHQQFAAVARRNASAPALVDAHGVLSYGDVFAASRELAAALEAHATDDDRLVVVRLGRSRHAPIALLAVLMSGRGYVPVDPEYPPERQAYLHADCGARLVIAEDVQVPGETELATLGPFTIAARSGASAKELPANVAYVIYTSGSTGHPKGCVVQHHQVLALLDACAGLLDVGTDDVWTLFHSASFDFSVWELWGAWITGGTAVVVPPRVATDPQAFGRMLSDRRVTVLNQTPAMFGFLTAEFVATGMRLPHLRYVILGGEAIRPTDILRWMECGVAPAAETINMYGITETTVHVTAGVLTAAACETARQGPTPIGRPLPHLTVSLRDLDGRDVAAGEPGEIWVAGAGVAAGYLDRPELTVERFVTTSSGRYYRSGDWAVADQEGRLHYLGRRDTQVKIRGHRIELGEIEATIAMLDDVQAVACGVEVTRSGYQVLAAYIVEVPSAAVTADAIRAHLRRHLPSHSQPHRVKRVAELPTTGNGKLDRSALPALPVLPWASPAHGQPNSAGLGRRGPLKSDSR